MPSGWVVDLCYARYASEFFCSNWTVSSYDIPSVWATDATTLTNDAVDTAGRFSKHREYLTGPSVSTRNLPLSVFFKSTFLSSEYTRAGPYDTNSPMSIDFASCFLLPANQCKSVPLILYDGRICNTSSSAFLEWIDEESRLALIVVGEQEYVAVVDPKNDEPLGAGARVKVNEAYAVVGTLPPAPGGGIVKIAEAMPDGRLKLGGDTPGSSSRIIVRSAALADSELKAGDEVRIDPSGRIALEKFEHQESRDYFLEEVPELPWENVGGQQEAISLIRDTIELPLLHPEVFAAYDQKPIKGILLYGPPGCGKTLIGKATAHNLAREYSEQTGRPVQEYFMAISGPKILNMWLGETERMVREIFRTAREKAKEGKLVFIFMDEAESVLRTRSSGRYLNISNTVVPQFCAELDGLQSLENVVLILTSNRPDYIDPAVLRPGRIERKVKVVRPDRASAEQILGIYLH